MGYLNLQIVAKYFLKTSDALELYLDGFVINLSAFTSKSAM